jgi:Cu/Ag efflux protein CusF
VVILAAAVAAATLFTADLHGEVVSVDRAHRLVVVHHHAHEGMRTEMMMAVRLRDDRQLAALHKGQFVQLRCDPRSNPYVCVVR